MKICKNCLIEKEESEFHTTGKNRTLKKECKHCINLKRKEKRKQNLEEFRKKDKKRYEKNAEKIRLRNKIYGNKNKENKAIKAKIRYKNNKNTVSLKNKEYYFKNKEKIKLKNKEWYKLNKEKVKIQKKIYLKTKNGKASIKSGRNSYRAKKRSSSDGTVTTAALLQLAQKQNNKCYYCGTSINIEDKNTHLDHYIPLSKGGKHSIKNVVWSCSKCNLSKNNTLPNKFIKEKICQKSLNTIPENQYFQKEVLE
jgi:hypothetical protein